MVRTNASILSTSLHTSGHFKTKSTNRFAGIFKASSCLKIFVGEDSLSANMTCCMLKATVTAQMLSSAQDSQQQQQQRQQHRAFTRICVTNISSAKTYSKLRHEPTSAGDVCPDEISVTSGMDEAQPRKSSRICDLEVALMISLDASCHMRG